MFLHTVCYYPCHPPRASHSASIYPLDQRLQILNVTANWSRQGCKLRETSCLLGTRMSHNSINAKNYTLCTVYQPAKQTAWLAYLDFGMAFQSCLFPQFWDVCPPLPLNIVCSCVVMESHSKLYNRGTWWIYMLVLGYVCMDSVVHRVQTNSYQTVYLKIWAVWTYEHETGQYLNRLGTGI